MRHAINRLVGFSNTDQTFDRVIRPLDSVRTNRLRVVHPPQQVENVKRVGNAGPNTTPDGESQATFASLPTFASLAACLPKARFFGGSDIEYTEIAQSAKECEAGQLVVYRLGIDCPVELIADALARGAAGILTEQILPCPLPQCIVGDTDHALAELTTVEVADLQTGSPDQRLLTIGVVGGSGKTTTALLISQILKDSPCRVAYHTDLGHSDGIAEATAELNGSREELLSGGHLISQLSDAVDAGAAVSVIELNSNALRYGGYDQIGLDMLVITNDCMGDSDFGPSPIECAIERVVDGGVVIGPVKNTQLFDSAKNHRLETVTYGVDTEADVLVKVVERIDGELTAMLTYHHHSAVVQATVGSGCLEGSIAAAATVGVLMETPLVQISESIGKVPSVAGRLEQISNQDWDVDSKLPKVYLDTAGSPDRLAFSLSRVRIAMRAASQSIVPARSITQRTNKLWCVLAVSATDSPETLMHYGRLLEAMPDQCILTCSPSDKKHFMALSHGVLDGVKECAALRLVADQCRAIRWAMETANSGDTVAVIGGLPDGSAASQRHGITKLKTDIQKLRTEIAEDISLTPVNSVAAKPAPLKLYTPESE